MKQKDYKEIIDLLLAQTGLFKKDELLELLIKTFLMKKKSDDKYYEWKDKTADEIMEEWNYGPKEWRPKEENLKMLRKFKNKIRKDRK